MSAAKKTLDDGSRIKVTSPSLASSERGEHGRQDMLLSSMLVPRSTPAHHDIPGLTRNPVLFLSWIPDQSHLAGSVTSGMTYVRFFRPRSCTTFQVAPESRPGGIAHKPPPGPKPASFRACPGIQCTRSLRSLATAQSPYRLYQQDFPPV